MTSTTTITRTSRDAHVTTGRTKPMLPSIGLRRNRLHRRVARARRPKNFSSAVIHTTAKDIAGNLCSPARRWTGPIFGDVRLRRRRRRVGIIYHAQRRAARAAHWQDNNDDDRRGRQLTARRVRRRDGSRAQSAQAVPIAGHGGGDDVDDDGDLDLATDPFDDMVTFWRNDRRW